MTMTMTIFTEYLKTWDACVGVRDQNIYLILDTCVTHLQDVFSVEQMFGVKHHW
jgi:hypothetical protein